MYIYREKEICTFINIYKYIYICIDMFIYICIDMFMLYLSGPEVHTCVQVGCVLGWNISGIQTFWVIFGEGMEIVWSSVRKPVPDAPDTQNTHPGHSCHSKHTSRTLRATRNSVLATCAPLLANQHCLCP